MIDLSNKYFLMIEPDVQGSPSEYPVEDDLTKKVDFIFSQAKPSKHCYRGFHVTQCGKHSDNRDWILSNGMITHKLCTYYIRYYRQYIPSSEIEKINKVFTDMGS